MDPKQLTRGQIYEVEGFYHLFQRPSELDFSFLSIAYGSIALEKTKEVLCVMSLG